MEHIILNIEKLFVKCSTNFLNSTQFVKLLKQMLHCIALVNSDAQNFIYMNVCWTRCIYYRYETFARFNRNTLEMTMLKGKCTRISSISLMTEWRIRIEVVYKFPQKWRHVRTRLLDGNQCKKRGSK